MSPLDILLLDIQRALLDAIVPQLRAVTADVDIKDRKLILFFFYDGVISDELFDLASVAATEAGVTLSDYFTEDHIVRLDYPQKIPVQGKLAYLRKEPILQEFILYKTAPSSERRPIVALLLQLQQALLGKVTPDLRAVAVDSDPEKKNRCLQILLRSGNLGRKCETCFNSRRRSAQRFSRLSNRNPFDSIGFSRKIFDRCWKICLFSQRAASLT